MRADDAVVTLGLGATVSPAGVRFEVWAPAARRVAVVVEGPEGRQTYLLNEDSEDGVFAGLVPGIGAGALYWFQLDDGPLLPDPYSRSQPDGPHGASEVVAPNAFAWSDAQWPGLSREGLVLYELQVGAFTPDGTFDGVIEQLPYLRELGVTALELMPVAAFPGQRGWGYDGVNLFAPYVGYGGPEGLRWLVDAAHAQGLGVLLDVVYNHLGPDGNYLHHFSPDYFTDRYENPWGWPLNFDGPNSHRVRELIIESACRWLREYHLDGLRIDAIGAMFDSGPRHIVGEVVTAARAAAAPRSVLMLAETDANDVSILQPEERGGFGFDAFWSDDFHHAARVAVTGEREGYYSDYAGSAEELARIVQDGFLYQGQIQPSTGRPRGHPTGDEPAARFIFCIQNHDQVANGSFGARLSTSVPPAAYRAISALLLLAPQTPLLFMGQEFAAATPFLFFTDHRPDLGRLITDGRRRWFAEKLSLEARERLPDPQLLDTFLRSRLDWREAEANAATLALYRDLLALRRTDLVLSLQDRTRLHAFLSAPNVIALHRWSEAGERLLLVNLGEREGGARAEGRILWHSNATAYGGDGLPPTLHNGAVTLLPWSAVLLERTRPRVT